MSTPNLFSDKAAVSTVAKYAATGVIPERVELNVPAATASGQIGGLIRFQKGFTLLSLELLSDDLDTSTNVTLDVGYVYDDTTGEDQDAFFNNIDIAQDAGSVVWPIADGLTPGSFVATGPGYLSVTTGGGATTTEGNIAALATFTYNA